MRVLRSANALKTLLVALALGAAVALAACGGDEEPPPPQQAQQSAARSERTPTEQDQQQQVERQERQATIQQQQAQAGAAQAQADAGDATPAAPRERGEFRIARAEPINLDPAQITDVSSAVIAVEIFGGLLVLDRDLRIAPGPGRVGARPDHQ